MAHERREGPWRAVFFAILPLLIGWIVMEALALAWFLFGPGAGRPKPPMLYESHPYRVYALAGRITDSRGRAWHNSHGLRGRETAVRKPPATVRIVCLGGSTTYGNTATTDSHTYPAHMERFLRDRYAEAPWRIEVINAGIPAYTSVESLILFQTRLLDFSPDVAVLHNGVNDAIVTSEYQDFASDYGHARRTFDPRSPHVWEYSPLLTLLFPQNRTALNPYSPDLEANLVSLIHKPWNPPDAGDTAIREARPQECAAALERNARTFLAIARGNAVIPVLSTMSYCPDGSLTERAVAACNDRLRALAAREAAPLADFARESPWHERVYVDKCHVADIPDGLERKGRIFADALIRAGVVEQAMRRLAATEAP